MTEHNLQAELDSIFANAETHAFKMQFGIEGYRDVNVMEPETPAAWVAVPVVVSVFRGWLLKKLRDLGCEQEAVIKEAAVRAIIAGVPNPFLQTLLIEVLSTAIDAMCPVD